MDKPTHLSQEDLNRLRHAQARARQAQAQAQWEEARLGMLVAGLAAKYQVGPGEFIQLDGFVQRNVIASGAKQSDGLQGGGESA